MDQYSSDTQRLIHLLWKRSSLDPVDIRVQVRASVPLLFPKPDLYLVLETLTDPCLDLDKRHAILDPVWIEGQQHSVQLLAANMPFWIVALAANGYRQFNRMYEVVRIVLRKIDSIPPDHILRWHVAAAT